MGTHPIFESDFDCLTEKSTLKQRNGIYLRHYVVCDEPRNAMHVLAELGHKNDVN